MAAERDQVGLSTEEFGSFVSGLDYPMFVVTAAADGRRAGCLVGFTSQVSIDPPRLLVSTDSEIGIQYLRSRAVGE